MYCSDAWSNPGILPFVLQDLILADADKDCGYSPESQRCSREIVITYPGYWLFYSSNTKFSLSENLVTCQSICRSVQTCPTSFTASSPCIIPQSAELLFPTPGKKKKKRGPVSEKKGMLT